jgi:hypothetical protein
VCDKTVSSNVFNLYIVPLQYAIQWYFPSLFLRHSDSMNGSSDFSTHEHAVNKEEEEVHADGNDFQSSPSWRRSLNLKHQDSPLLEKIPGTCRVTVTQIESLGKAKRQGIVQIKLAGMLGKSWKKKYFVLDGHSLSYYDKEAKYLEDPSSYNKRAQLTESSCVGHTDVENCFIMKGFAGNESDPTWLLKTETAQETKDWKAYINAHIHCIYTHNLSVKSGQEVSLEAVSTLNISGGDPSTSSFWQLPLHASDGATINPVGIRSVADVNGPRTGEGVHPGEVVEVLEVLPDPDPDSPLRYLRLADDRGWLFDIHPSTRTPLLLSLQKDVHYSCTGGSTKMKIEELRVR